MNAVAERPRVAKPAPALTAATAVTQSAAGDWMFDGKIVRCSLGHHEGKARSNAMAKHLSQQLAPLSPADRERFILAFNAAQERAA